MNGDMNGKQLFELLGGIDDDIVEDAWTEESGIVAIIEKRPPLRSVKISVAAAACIAVMTAAVYGFVKTRRVDYNQPGSTVEYSSVSTGDGTGSLSDSGITSADEDLDKPLPSEYRGTAPDITLASGALNFTVHKYDDYEFAVFYVEETNASEDKPVYVTVCCSDNTGAYFFDPVSEPLKITGTGKYAVRYNRPFPSGSTCYLHIETCGESYAEEGQYDKYYGLILNGRWIP